MAGLFNSPLVNVPVDVLYTRRKLLEKIVQNMAQRKIQNSMLATGDRMTATPEQFGKNLAQSISQMGKKAGIDLRGALRGAIDGNYGKMLESTVPKAENVFGRYKQLLTFDRFRRMQGHMNDGMNALKQIKMPAEELMRVRKQLEDVAYPELFKSVGTAGGTGLAGYAGLKGLSGMFSAPQQKQSAESNPADAHGSSYVPLLGGAISAAVKPHPSLGTLTNVIGEGRAGMRGGALGAMMGGAGGAVADLATRFKGRGVPTLLGALLGGSIGTHIGAQTHREGIPLNARAMAQIMNTKQAGILDEVARRVGAGARGVVTGHGGHLLEAMTPKAQGLKRYLELLTFGRSRAMYNNAEKLFSLHPKAPPEFAEQMSEAYLPEVYKSMGTAGGTGVAGMMGLNSLAGAFSAPQQKQAVVGGGILGALVGAARAPEDHKLEGAGRGALRGAVTHLGAQLGGNLAANIGHALMRSNPALGFGLGAIGGATAGGLGGYGLSGKLLNSPSWQRNAAPVAPAPAAPAPVKTASIPEGLVAAIPGAVSGGTAGLGVGALYGLLSGALQARKGKKLRGAAMGALRGAGGGGLIGAGIGGGLGLGTGLMMPNVLTTDPVTQAETAVSIARRPIGHAAKMMLGATVGGIGGGMLGNKARKGLIGDKAEDAEDEDEGLETEDKTQADPALKAAGLVPSFQQAAREGLEGMRGRFKILGNMQGVAKRLLEPEYRMPTLDQQLNIVNRGKNHSADIAAQLHRMMKQMRVPQAQIDDVAGNTARAVSGVAPMKFHPQQLQDFARETSGR